MDIKHVKKICKLGHGDECCAYLVVGTNGFECEKNKREWIPYIGERVKNGMMCAKGNNCDGFYLCPQCKNSEHATGAKFCKICGLKVER